MRVEAWTAVPRVLARAEVGVGRAQHALLCEGTPLRLREHGLTPAGVGLDAVDRFDAHDVGAPLAEDLRDVRPGPHDRDRGDSDTLEG